MLRTAHAVYIVTRKINVKWYIYLATAKSEAPIDKFIT